MRTNLLVQIEGINVGDGLGEEDLVDGVDDAVAGRHVGQGHGGLAEAHA